MLFLHVPIEASLAYEFDGMLVEALNEFTAIRGMILILKAILTRIIGGLGACNQYTAAH